MNTSGIPKDGGSKKSGPMPHVMKEVIEVNLQTGKPAGKPTPSEDMPPEALERRMRYPKLHNIKQIVDHPTMGV